METFPVLLALWAGNSPMTCEFPIQRLVTRKFYIFFHLRLKKRLKKIIETLVIWDGIALIMTSLQLLDEARQRYCGCLN